jgi:hypothetical protein
MDFDAAVEPGSSPGSEPSTTPSPGTSAPDHGQEPQQQQQVPFHQHPRFREITSQNRELRSTVAQLQSRLNAIEQRAQSQGGATPQQQQEYADAAAALRKVMAADPELAELLQLRQRIPQLAQGVQGVQHLQAQAARAQQAQARSHIESLVKEAGIALDKKALPHVIRLVAGAAMQLPDGNERYERGDFSVLSEAFADVKSFIEALRQPANVATAQTKNKLKTLPTPNRGGSAAGPAAPDAPKPGEERAFTQSLHKRGLDMLRSKLSG